MGTGYVRQSTADIVAGNTVEASPLNDEFNAIQAAFGSSLGHSHDGTSGEGPLIDLTTSITGLLPAANGGFGAIHKVDATTAPTANDDSGDGYGPGSFWVDVTGDTAYVCLDATSTAAVWRQVSFEATIAALEDLTPTDGNVIVGNGSTWIAESGATLRTSVGLGTGDSPQFTGIELGHATDTTITRVSAGVVAVEGSNILLASGLGSVTQAYDAGLADIAGLAVTDGNIIVGDGANWVAESGATARASLGLVIGTDVQAQDAELSALAGLTSASNKIPRFTGSGTADLLDFVDEDNMASDSNTAVPSQQSVKAYVDAQIGGVGFAIDDLSDVTITSAATGDFLRHNGTAWVDSTIQAGDIIEAAVTQHEAALSITESQITDLGTSAVLTSDIGSTVQAYDVDTLKADTGDQLAAGYDTTAVDIGTKSSGTYTPAAQSDGSNFLYGVNGGAFTLGVPANNCSIVLHLTNNGSAGAITTSGWTLVEGDTYDTTDTYEFILYITKVNDVSHLVIKALQ